MSTKVRTARPRLQSSQSGIFIPGHVAHMSARSALHGWGWQSLPQRVRRSYRGEVRSNLKERVGIPQAGGIPGEGTARQSPGGAGESCKDSCLSEKLRLSS